VTRSSVEAEPFIFVTVFAPIAVIQGYEDVEEAIELANGTKYGLGASVFGPDESYAIQVAKQLKCGMVAVNDFGVFYVSAPPFSVYRIRLLTSCGFS
jgi:acyl-CoA reductase-like NAD-dependent aldehyde dehydrogenase